MDYTLIAAGIDYASLLTGLGSVAIAISTLYIAIRGAKTILSFIKS